LVPPLYAGLTGDETDWANLVAMFTTSAGLTVLGGKTVCLAGIAMCGWAGMSEEAELTDEQKRETVKEFALGKGFAVAAMAGILSACFAFGLAAVADVLNLTPEGVPQVFQPPASAMHNADGRLPDKKGYAFDGCSPRIPIEYATVKDGKIVFPGGTTYQLLVLPDWPTMTPQLLSTLKTLIHQGASVVGRPPTMSPSLSSYPQCDEVVTTLAKELWGSLDEPNDLTRRSFGSGSLWWGAASSLDPGKLYPHHEQTAAILKLMGVREDFPANGPIRFGHRRTNDRDIYFVSNTLGETVNADCTFRATSDSPELWDPVTGSIQPLSQFEETDGMTTVPLEFAPHQSYFVVFPRVAQQRDEHDGLNQNFSDCTTLVTLDGPWQVSLDPAKGGPSEVVFEQLADWLESENDSIRHYSGIATYRKTFQWGNPIEANDHATDDRLYLDLGTVHEIARVKLNGVDLGVVWCAPWNVDISSAVKIGVNALQIEVANLWPNRLIGDANLPADKRIINTSLRVYKKDTPLMKSGLLGPITLQRMQQ
jgi:hypothetical protein